ncbi:MAG: glycosyltransferase family 1 protein [Gammaproteobacteria bacterium]
MKLLIVTDTWSPQVNGVVTTLRTIGEHISAAGHTVEFLSPDGFRSMPCPTYPEIRLSVLPYRRVRDKIDSFQPDALHIATEGPLGYAARRYCITRGLQFTTAYHTRFPEYVHARTRIPVALTYGWLRRFHDRANAMLVPTPALRRELQERGFDNTVPWSHGVDTEKFTPGDRGFLQTRSPIFLYVGRVAIEKNIEAFLQLDLPGSKWVVGEGPQRAWLERRYPEANFAGIQTTDNLVRFYRAANVFVFPSLTDTFGLVMLEALACGTPVAAFPVTGPMDVIGNSGVGAMDKDLRQACLSALNISRADARAYAEQYSWDQSIRQFESYLTPLRAA